MMLSLKQKNRLLVQGVRTISLNNRLLIETEELQTLIKEEPEKLTIFNATYSIGGIIPREEHTKSRIPTSIFYDFNDFSHKDTKFSYMVPTEEEFRDQMKKVGVRKNDIIVVYDKIGMISAPRAFWLLKTFGLENVFLLNGVFNKWQAEARPVETGDADSAWKRVRSTVPAPGDFNFNFDKRKIEHYSHIRHIA